MNLNLRIVGLLVIIGIFGFSSTILAQTNKKTTGKTQAKTGATAATSKKAKNPTTGETVIPNNPNTRPPSTGTGNNTRPASTGESVSEIEKVVRQLVILRNGVSIPKNITEDSGSNLTRIKNYIDQAENKSDAFYNAVQSSNSSSSDWNYNYNPLIPKNLNEVKNNLQKALNDLNSVQFEVGENHRLSAIDFTERAINQIDAYLINPPKPSKKAPNGAKPAKNKGTSQNNEQQMTNSNDVSTTLKTKPVGSTEKTTPSKTTNKKPKASSKTIKPTENLDPLDDPWGKTPKKPKTKGNN